MKTRRIILILFAVLSIMSGLKAQQVDTIAIARISNIMLLQPDSLQFDIRLLRVSDRWDKWANGTFQLSLTDTNFVLSSDLVDIEYISGSSHLNVQPLTGQLPTESYYITPRIIKDRFSITIAGPEEYSSSRFIPADTGVKIGTFLVTSKLGEHLPVNLNWKQPQFYYQACAYKLKNDSLGPPPNVPWAGQNDNIEMDDGGVITTVKYDIENVPPPEMILDYFTAEYVGLRKVALDWATLKEAYNLGFFVKRGIVPYGTHDTDRVDFGHPVCHFEGGRPGEELLVGLGTRDYGQEYHWYFDTVDYRGEEYCYALYYKDFNNEEHYLAMACVPIPNAVITYAQANPNPMSYTTTITYKLDDDVMLTVTAYDMIGKEVKKLIDNEYVERGTHELIFDAPISQVASQGLYEVIFLAKPVDDPSVEISRAIVKIQVIR